MKLLKVLFLITLFLYCSPLDNSTDENTTNLIPNGAIWKKETIVKPTAPLNYTAVVAWMQAATLEINNSYQDAYVVIEYIKIYERGITDNLVYTLTFNQFNNTPLPANYGGLYVRSPKWFDTDNHTPITNSIINNGLLTLYVGQTPNNILHWWTDRINCKPNYRYFLEVKLLISEGCSVQCGSDYWKDLTAQYNGYDKNCLVSNNCEAWISDWYGNTKGKFITIKVPLN